MQSRQPDQGISEPRMGFCDELTGRVRSRHPGAEGTKARHEEGMSFEPSPADRRHGGYDEQDKEARLDDTTGNMHPRRHGRIVRRVVHESPDETQDREHEDGQAKRLVKLQLAGPLGE